MSITFKIDPTFNYTLFKQAQLPAFAKDKNTIFLFCQNFYDGVGDFSHAATYSREMKSLLRNSGYKIVGVIAIMTFSKPSEENALKNKRAEQVKGKLQRGEHAFDEYYIIEIKDEEGMDVAINRALMEFNSKARNLPEQLKHGAANFLISYGRDFIDVFFQNNLLSAPPVYCYQIHALSLYNKAEYGCILSNGTMGLPRHDVQDEHSCYGLKLKQRNFSEEDKANRLLSFSGEAGRSFVKALLNSKMPTFGQAIEYFRTHTFSPGYPQGKHQATSFVIITILKNCDDTHRLMKNCDFHLPGNAVDHELLQKLCKEFSLKNIEWVTPDATTMLSEKDDRNLFKVRIFTNYFLDDIDYEEMYHFSESISACSGDNSISYVFSSEHLPFVQGKPTSISKFFFYQLLPYFDFVKQELQKENKLTPDLADGFDKLKKYFMTMIGGSDWVTYNLMAVKKEITLTEQDAKLLDFFKRAKLSNAPIDSTTEAIDRNKISIYLKSYVEYINVLVLYAKDNNVASAWKAVRNHMHKHYNYYDVFPAILAGALYLSNPNPKIDIQGQDAFSLSHYLCGSQYIQDLRTKGKITEDEINNLTLAQAELLSCTSVYEDIIQDKFSVVEALQILKDLKENVKEAESALKELSIKKFRMTKL